MQVIHASQQKEQHSASLHAVNVLLVVMLFGLQVEELLRDKLSKSLAAVTLALDQLDRRGQGTVRQEELRKVIQHYGLPLSDQHFNR